MTLAIDHVVLPVADLGNARTRMTALGFSVAADALHPFGTANCCVYFADGTYLEPLAIADEERYGQAIAEGNVFVARDRDFRARHPGDGSSALAFASADAAEDHRRFGAAGLSAGPMLEFSRPFVDQSGRADMASFSLAFAVDRRASDVFFFAVERKTAMPAGRSALEWHPNGVTGLAKVVLTAGDPTKFAAVLGSIADADPLTAEDGFAFSAGAGTVALVAAETAQTASGAVLRAGQGLALSALSLRTDDLARLEALLGRNGVSCERRDGALFVPPAPGQGAAFLFEASR